MGLRIRNGGARKSVSQLGEKKPIDQSNSDVDEPYAHSTAERKKTSINPMSPMGSGKGTGQSHRHTPLYKKLQDSYFEREEAMTLETKKKRLEELRSLNKPVRKTDILEHALKYEKIRTEKLET